MNKIDVFMCYQYKKKDDTKKCGFYQCEKCGEDRYAFKPCHNR